ncbi:flavin reductase family protein [Kitasatospora sp. NPDC094028]
MCAAFAGPPAKRFATGNWESREGRALRLDGAVAWIECEVADSVAAGDHTAVLGRVRSLDAADDGRRRPLVFHRGRLVRLDRAHTGHAPTGSFYRRDG